MGCPQTPKSQGVNTLSVYVAYLDGGLICVNINIKGVIIIFSYTYYPYLVKEPESQLHCLCGNRDVTDESITSGAKHYKFGDQLYLPITINNIVSLKVYCGCCVILKCTKFKISIKYKHDCVFENITNKNPKYLNTFVVEPAWTKM